jgi:hypothetical protein
VASTICPPIAPAHRQIARGAQHRVEALEQAPDRPRPGQPLAEQPDGLGIGHPVLEGEAQEPHEREPVPDLVLGLVVGERVERLQDQHLEHQHRIVRRPAAPGPVRAGERRLEIAAEHLEVDHRQQPLQRIARRRQAGVSLVPIEEARLARHAILPATTCARESRLTLSR